MENKEWWRKKADEMFFVEDYNNQDEFDAGIEALVIESQRLERERIVTLIREVQNSFTDAEGELGVGYRLALEQIIKAIDI